MYIAFLCCTNLLVSTSFAMKIILHCKTFPLDKITSQGSSDDIPKRHRMDFPIWSFLQGQRTSPVYLLRTCPVDVSRTCPVDVLRTWKCNVQTTFSYSPICKSEERHLEASRRLVLPTSWGRPHMTLYVTLRHVPCRCTKVFPRWSYIKG